MSSLENLVEQSLNVHSLIVIGWAFIAGVASSVLPCMISMLPILLGYIGVVKHQSKQEIFLQVSLFIIGLASVMTILGVMASFLGIAFGSMLGSTWYYVIGAFSIIMALQLLNFKFISIPFPGFVTRFPETRQGKILTPLIFGMIFGTASSPCGTPFLAVILTFISRENNVLLGGISLFFYALGQGVILFVAGISAGILKHMATMRRFGSLITKLSAAIFILTGIALIIQGAGMMPELLRFLPL